MTYDVHEIRRDFPILAREVNGKPLVYLDNGASAQKPQVVIDAVTRPIRWNTPTSTAGSTTCRTSPPRSTRPCAAPSRAS
jgi:selenocysteine lyase/cysteine desulfurase